MKNRTNILFWLQLAVLAVVGFLIWSLGDSRGPLLFSALLAYLCQPLVLKLEKKGVQRSLATVIVFFAILSPLIVLLLVSIPVFAANVGEFAATFPQKTAEFLRRIDGIAQSWGYQLPVNQEELLALIQQKVQLLSFDLLQTATGFLKSSALSLTSAIVILLNVILVPVFFIYVLNDYEHWARNFASMIPLQARPFARRFSRKADDVVGSYFRGQIIACLVLATMYGAALWAVDLPFGLVIGVLTGFFSFIPYLGFGLGFAIALIVAVASGEGFGLVALVAVVMLIGQVLESFIITPKMVGNQVGLTSLEALVALIVCGNLFGFVGLLLAIPAGALFKESFTELRRAAGV